MGADSAKECKNDSTAVAVVKERAGIEQELSERRLRGCRTPVHNPRRE